MSFEHADVTSAAAARGPPVRPWWDSGPRRDGLRRRRRGSFPELLALEGAGDLFTDPCRALPCRVILVHVCVVVWLELERTRLPYLLYNTIRGAEGEGTLFRSF